MYSLVALFAKYSHVVNVILPRHFASNVKSVMNLQYICSSTALTLITPFRHDFQSKFFPSFVFQQAAVVFLAFMTFYLRELPTN